MKTLMDVFLYYVVEANSHNLTRFVFCYNSKTYYSEFHKGVWTDPIEIDLL